MKRLIGMTSITYAIKAQNILNSLGYRCDVVSTPKNLGSGCGYSLAVRDDPEKLAEILKKHDIKIVYIS